ncbi:fumarylacetoacetate hydrolase family protein [uncultured Rothia sp.]
MGQRARRLTLQEASSAIWGYTVMNDISVRDWQGAYQ